MRRSHRLYCGDVRVAQDLDLEPVLDALESHARLRVAVRSRRGVFLRAGAVAWRGRAIVLAGASRSRKTTLVAELVRAGAAYLSDDWAVVRGDRVVPYPGPPSGRDPRPLAGRAPARVPPPGGALHHRAIPVGLVVLARFERGAAVRAHRLPRGRALLALLSHAVAARIAPDEVLSTLEGLVRAAPVLRVDRGDARATARRILGWMSRRA
jgi:hypothetical protein